MTNLDPTKWVSRGSLIFPSCSRDTSPKRFFGSFDWLLLKVATRAISSPKKPVRAAWKYSGVLFAATPKGEEFGAVRIRLNTTQLLTWNGSSRPYQISFQPYGWLPNCRITVWEYQFQIPQANIFARFEGNGPDGLGIGLSGSAFLDTLDGGIG
jgi:hypothetical protein